MESDPEEFKEEFVEEPEGEEEGDGEEFDEEVEEEEVTNVPHSFFLDDLAMPRPCDHCDELMWGLTKQGYRCSGAALLFFPCCEFGASAKTSVPFQSAPAFLRHPLRRHLHSSIII